MIDDPRVDALQNVKFALGEISQVLHQKATRVDEFSKQLIDADVEDVGRWLGSNVSDLLIRETLNTSNLVSSIHFAITQANRVRTSE